MKTHSSSQSLTLACAFEQFIKVSSFARRICESCLEDPAPLFAQVGQMLVIVLTASVIQSFLALQASLAPAIYNRCLAMLRRFTWWLRDQGWLADVKSPGA